MLRSQLSTSAIPAFSMVWQDQESSSSKSATGRMTKRLQTQRGNVVPNSGSVNSVSGLTHVAWLSKQRILGGWYGVEVVGTAAYVDAGAKGQRGRFGDMTVGPVILQWSEHRILGVPIDQRAVIDFDVPVGKYSQTSPVNLSSNAFTFHPYYAITAFPTKHIETSWRVHYFWNSVNHVPPMSTEAQSTQAGQAIHFNATAAYHVYKGLWIGPNGTTCRRSPMAESMEQLSSTHRNRPWNGMECRPMVILCKWLGGVGSAKSSNSQKIVLRVEKIF
jgi:hypothetical protein